MKVQVSKCTTGGETPTKTNIGEKTSVVPSLFHVYCFHLDILFRPQFWQKLGPSTHSLRYFRDNSYILR